jgi:plastocyanin
VRIRHSTIRLLALVALCLMMPLNIHSAQVAGHVDVVKVKGADQSHHDASVVVWLAPLTGKAERPLTDQGNVPHAQLIQKNKMFEPHLVVVEVGSQVDFPNHDPFFHNVFSLFNGKRFDLGLYEAGSTRSVRFDRSGICYIFCNIHPQMSAIVVVVDTPYFAVSSAQGDILIPRVPSGRYQMNVWEEHCTPKDLEALARPITVGENDTPLGKIQLRESGEPAVAHLNKYGKPYDPEVFSGPIYVKP